MIEFVASEQQSAQDAQDEKEEMEYEHSVKQRILKSSINHVNDLGWTKQALEAGQGTQNIFNIFFLLFFFNELKSYIYYSKLPV